MIRFRLNQILLGGDKPMYPRRLVCAQAMWSWHPLCSVTTGERGRSPRACILAGRREASPLARSMARIRGHARLPLSQPTDYRSLSRAAAPSMLGVRLPPAPWCSLRRSRASRVTLGVVCRLTPPAMPWRDGWSALDPRGQLGLEEGAEQVAARNHAAHGARAIDAHELAHVGVC